MNLRKKNFLKKKKKKRGLGFLIFGDIMVRIVSPALRECIKESAQVARRTGKDSATYYGTQYEYTVLKTLQRLGFALDRVGGRGDGGIDLLGRLYFPQKGCGSNDMGHVNAFVQCKAHNKTFGPHHVREMEGVMMHQDRQAIGILSSLRPLKGSALERLGSSILPLCYAFIDIEGNLRQWRWNNAASMLLPQNTHVTTEYDSLGNANVVIKYGTEFAPDYSNSKSPNDSNVSS